MFAVRPRRVLLEWTQLDRRWRPADIQIARSRVVRLVRELSIPSKPSALRILQTLGVVEDFQDERHKRFGIIYSLPFNSSAVHRPVLLQDFFPRDEATLSTLKEPLLSQRFKLAHTLAAAIHEMHNMGWLHKELSSYSIAFLHYTSSSVDSEPDVNVLEPYITGFGYSRPDTEEAISLVRSSSAGLDFYRHPMLRVTGQSTEEEENQPVPRFQRKFDVYSLGLVLLEIGLWDKIATFERSADKADPQAFADRLVRVSKLHLGHRMGAIYRDVVVRCIRGIGGGQGEGEVESKEEELMAFYWGVLRELAKCHCK